MLRSDGWMDRRSGPITRPAFAKVRQVKTLIALDLCQNFISSQYLKNILMEFDQILHMF